MSPPEVVAEAEPATIRLFDAPLRLFGHEPTPGRLRFPHTLHCEGCRHEPVLDVDPDRLRGPRPARR